MTYVATAPRFYNPSAPLQAALDSVPGYTAHVHALEALKPTLAAATKAHASAQDTLDGISNQLAEALLTTTPDKAPRVVETHGAKADEAAVAANRAAAHVAFLNAAEITLGQELDGVISGCADRVLKHLNTTLQGAYEASWKLGLEGIHDAETAIEKGLAEQWAEMLRLRGTIFAIRAAQSTIVGRLGSLENVQRIATFGALRNYGDVDPTWLERKVAGGWGAGWARQHLKAPFDVTADGNPDPISLHQFVLDNPDARPWVPTEKELVATVKEATQAARAAMQKEEATA